MESEREESQTSAMPTDRPLTGRETPVCHFGMSRDAMRYHSGCGYAPVRALEWRRLVITK